MGNQLAVQSIIGSNRIPVLLYNLLGAQTVVVVLEGQSSTFGAHCFQSAAGFPLVSPYTITELEELLKGRDYYMMTKPPE